VKLIRSKREQLVFEISLSEKRLLSAVLKLYPLISATHHRLTKSARTAKHDENQKLLEESLAAQREENRKNVRAMLDEPGRFQAAASGFQLTLSGPEIEWLLQVLNDVRVGSWIAIGSPDPERGGKILFKEKLLPHFRTMELAGAFEMVFLDALSGRTTTE
jgi:hypothetical protein